MSLATPPLNALRVFDAIAKMRNITKAADALHITQSAASQQMKLLEDYLNAKLLERKKGRICLTLLGERYAEKISRALDDIRNATQSLKTTCLRDKKIAINSPTTFAMRWLFKRLPNFQHKCPDFDLTISTPFREIDFEHEDYDAAIYFGVGSWPNLTAIQLLKNDVVAVCSPKLLCALKKQGPVTLDKFTLISGENSSPNLSWRNWLKNFPLKNNNATLHYLKLSTVEQTLEAAAQGNGLALSLESLVQEDIEQKKLVIPFKERFKTKESIYFVYPSNRENNGKIVALREWLMEEINKVAK